MNDGRGLATVNPDFQIVMREMAYPYFETISEMACLRMNDDVDIDIQHYERIRVEHAQALLDSRLWRSRYGRMPDDWGKMTHSLKPSKNIQPISKDILGEYLPDKRRIVVYDQTCLLVTYALAAKGGSLCVPVPSGPELALAHAVSHAVSHLGVDRNGNIWDRYENSSSAEKELFAQGYSRHFLERNWLNSILFRSLAKHQSAEYNQYEHAENLRELNAMLMKTREDTGLRGLEGGGVGHE
jgi:hypothetical protein